MAQLDQENIWKIVKKIRKSFFSKHSNPTCPSYIVLADNYIKGNIDHLAEELQLSPSSIPQDNISYELLQTAGEIFTYLNYCPPNILPLLTHILKTGTPKDIILALTSIVKNPLKIVKQISRTILLKVIETFELDEYEKIQVITKGKCYINGTFGNCKNNLDLNEEDLKLLGMLSFQFYMIIKDIYFFKNLWKFNRLLT